ncbi:RNA-directed DNA polymerase [Nitrosospira sp. NpAV]|uniref:RNA-directed DNA polymerase n=1 Tax=Nitrosospira sp. NpAV TaxID=58133 RepID=UPI0005A259F3|nr:RNA-directed DNA polymerase [Nitrosospira sp. NpAV]KIO48757.1 hypothetical protein SQ11_09460 [Nitrosospira sp. NpAV]
MIIELGRIQFSESSLFKQLRYDLKDDWFPDPLGYEDMIDTGLITTRINDNFESNHGEYVPSARHILNVPKPNFTLRYALETGLADRALYHGLASFLIPFFDKLIPWNVFSHRYNYLRPNERYMFRRAIPAWQDFVGTVRSDMGEDKILLSTDIANYFENISLPRLKSAFLEMLPEVQANSAQKADIRSHIQLLFSCLQAWTYEPDRGLPQNRDASSFLANVYMRRVDLTMLRAGFAYFRYMDDIKIVCSSVFEARSALKQLSVCLRDIGLSINSKKTVIAPGTDSKLIAECLDDGSPEVQRIDEIWKTRSRSAILRSIPDLKALFQQLITENKTDSRDFRYCIRRMEFLALCNDFYVPPELYSDVTPQIIKAIPDHPASTDQFVRYLLAVPTDPESLASVVEYLRDGVRAIYSWQNYRLWSLLAQKGYKDSKHLHFAKDVLKAEPDGPVRAGATIYIAATGGLDDKIEVAQNFRTLKSFLGQRIALIAMHELAFNPYIKVHVKEYVRDDLVGVYRKLNSEKKGRYFLPPERMSIAKVADLDRDYE